MTQRTCDVDDCDRKHRARGLCAMHWKREHGKRTKYPITCVTCGSEWLSDRPNGRFCSDECKGRDYAQSQLTRCRLPDDHPVMVETARRKAEEREALRTEQRLARLAWRSPRECPGCGAEFSPLWTPTVVCCSRRCRKRIERRRRRLSDRHIGWVWSEFMRIAAKFDGCCAYCGDRPDRLDPDHVVPLARGGADSTTNLLPACPPCNSSKGARLLPEWAAWRAERGLPPRVTTWDLGDPRFTHLTHALLISPAA